MAVDWKALSEWENRKDAQGNILRENTTYIPKKEGKPIQNSGVTVGAGIDLGQHTEEGLKGYGVPMALIKILKPYLGKTQDKAVEALNSNGPVTLTDEELDALEIPIKKHFATTARKWFNKANTADMDWSDLSDKQQTVVLSVYWNHGKKALTSYNFGKQVANNEWDKVADNLRNFYSSPDNELHSRRIKELQYLIGARVDGAAGDETAAKLDAFKQNFKASGQFPIEAPSVSVREPAERITSAASQTNPSDLLTTLAQSLGELLKSSQGGSQAVSEPSTAPATADTEVRETESEEEATARGEEDPLEAFIQSAIDYQEQEVEPEAEDNLDKFVQWASGTEETAPPVYVEMEGNWNGDRDPTYGIF